jgi:hypothetical protein
MAGIAFHTQIKMPTPPDDDLHVVRKVDLESMAGYSIYEQDTGYNFIDGKRIYRRSFPVTHNASIATTADVNFGVKAPDDIDSMVDARFIAQSSRKALRSNSFVTFPELRVGIRTDGNFGGFTGSTISTLVANSGVLTVWYTKKQEA